MRFPLTEVVFDVKVTDVDAPFYSSCSVVNVLATAEDEKKWKYMVAIKTCHASFSP